MVDTSAFEQIYRDHYPDMLRYCARRSHRSAAQDATAETFAIAWRRRGDVPTDRPLPWLYGVAWKVLANHRRSESRVKRTATRLAGVKATTEPGPELTLIRRAEENAVRSALERLSRSDRPVHVGVDEENQSYVSYRTLPDGSVERSDSQGTVDVPPDDPGRLEALE